MKRRKSITHPRSIAYALQSGKCFYCGQPMWQDDLEKFAAEFGINPGLAKRFQCTGEHLLARQDGGRETLGNIVAACRFCNWTRHVMKSPLDPERYKNHVQKRINNGRWHPVRLL